MTANYQHRSPAAVASVIKSVTFDAADALHLARFWAWLISTCPVKADRRR
jgi:hypothetical protein